MFDTSTNAAEKQLREDLEQVLKIFEEQASLEYTSSALRNSAVADPQVNKMALKDRQVLLSSQTIGLMLQIYKNAEILQRAGRSIPQMLSTGDNDTATEINEHAKDFLYSGVYRILTHLRSTEFFHRLLSDDYFINLASDDDDKLMVADTLIYPFNDTKYTPRDVQKLHPEIIQAVVKNFATFEPILCQMEKYCEDDRTLAEKEAYLHAIRTLADSLRVFFLADKTLDFAQLARVIVTETHHLYPLVPYLIEQIIQDPECKLDPDDKARVSEIMNELMDIPNLVYDQMPLSILQKWLTLDALICSELPLAMKVDMVRENLAAINAYRRCLAELLVMPDEVMASTIHAHVNTLVNLQSEQLKLPFKSHDIQTDFSVINYVLKDSSRLEKFCQAQYDAADLAPDLAAQEPVSPQSGKYGKP